MARAIHRQAVPPGELDGAQHRLILFLDELADGLPNPDALRPLLGHTMIIRSEVIPHRRGGDRVGRLAGRSPEHLERGRLRFLQERPHTVETGSDQDLVETRYVTGGAEGNKQLGEAGDGQLGALHVQVTVDEPRRQIATAGVEDAGAIPGMGCDVPDRDDRRTENGHVGSIDLRGGDVHQAAVGDHQARLQLAGLLPVRAP
jgi:hypothetical protein